MPVTVSGLVLAGGRGRRLGRPKAMVRLGATTLVERAVASIGAIAGDVIVVARPEVPLPPLPAMVVHDRPGPPCALNAVATGLAAAAGEVVVVLACDLPLAGPLLPRLCQAAPGAAAAVATAPGGMRQPLCARYERAAALCAALDLLASGELRMMGLLERLGAASVAATADELRNVNAPGDLEAVRAVVALGSRPAEAADGEGGRP